MPATSSPVADILVVDDEHLVRWSLARALRDAGYAVTVTHDGPGALDLLRLRRFDLVITDLHLPGMDGLAVAEHVQPPTPVLLISADPNPPSWSSTGHIRAFMPKPFALQDLATAVRSLLNRGG